MIDNPDLLVLRKRELVALLIISLSSEIYIAGEVLHRNENFFVARYLFYSLLGFFDVQYFSPSLIFCVHITKGGVTSNNGHTA